VGNLTFGTITPLLSHAAAGAGRVRTLLISQPEGGKGTCEPARSDTLDTVGLQTLGVWAQ
jgi:stage III sporulation protein SpoIIIAA